MVWFSPMESLLTMLSWSSLSRVQVRPADTCSAPVTLVTPLLSSPEQRVWSSITRYWSLFTIIIFIITNIIITNIFIFMINTSISITDSPQSRTKYCHHLYLVAGLKEKIFIPFFSLIFWDWSVYERAGHCTIVRQFSSEAAKPCHERKQVLLSSSIDQSQLSNYIRWSSIDQSIHSH